MKKLEALNPEMDVNYRNILLQVKKFFYHILSMKEKIESFQKDEDKSNKKKESTKSNHEELNDHQENKENIQIELDEASQEN